MWIDMRAEIRQFFGPNKEVTVGTGRVIIRLLARHLRKREKTKTFLK